MSNQGHRLASQAEGSLLARRLTYMGDPNQDLTAQIYHLLARGNARAGFAYQQA
jgi:hypothetical protein